MVDISLKKLTNEPVTPIAEWSRVVIEGVSPEVDSGKYAAKRVVGEKVVVSAHIHADGHNALACLLLSRKLGESRWSETYMELADPGLDRWQGMFRVPQLGFYEFTVHAWIDQFANLQRDAGKKHKAEQSLTVEREELAKLMDAAAQRSDELSARTLSRYASDLRKAPDDGSAMTILANPQLETLMRKHAPRGRVCEYSKNLPIMVEPERALYGAWYELFPRSCGTDERRKHGTLKDVVKQLPYIADMGFDVLYLPPIHPIGYTHRKGKNNSLTAQPGEPGSPWAIGSDKGGHKSVHPELGTIEAFDNLVSSARELKLDIALDIAFQCSPDHPYVKEHPQWFYHRPDGSIRYAENPPKKYEDIYPIDFECADWQNLWRELTDVILFWVAHGVTIFRVDNPHTKPFAFWQYLIHEVKTSHPDVIFLSEAFARPRIMYHLGKLGFSQSYSYFTWRNNKHELTSYFSEVYTSAVSEYFRPNLFANTPDIFPEFLQYGGRRAYMIRLVLAATLGASYGIYGPAFELCATDALPNSEEYKDSEKYEIHNWDLQSQTSLSEFIARMNKIRKQNSALHQNRNIRFLNIDNDDMIAFAKTSADGNNTIVTVVNLNPHYAQEGILQIPTTESNVEQTYQVHDLITGMRFLWSGEANRVRLDPAVSPAFVFKILRKLRSERDFDYFV